MILKLNAPNRSLAVMLALSAFALILNASVHAYETPSQLATRSVKPGDHVVLNQSISAPSGAKIYLQNGQTLGYSEIQWAKPYCYFHLYRNPSLVNTEASLKSGNFTIEATQNRYEHVLLDQPRIRFVAGFGFRTQDASEQSITTQFKLRSSTQPEVIGLNCAVWGVPNERRHLSLEEIKGALGQVVTLKTSNNA